MPSKCTCSGKEIYQEIVYSLVDERKDSYRAISDDR